MNNYTLIIAGVMSIIIFQILIRYKSTSEIEIKKNKIEQNSKCDSLQLQINKLQEKMDEIYPAFKLAE